MSVSVKRTLFKFLLIAGDSGQRGDDVDQSGPLLIYPFFRNGGLNFAPCCVQCTLRSRKVDRILQRRKWHV